jgi:hypothetical protein
MRDMLKFSALIGLPLILLMGLLLFALSGGAIPGRCPPACRGIDWHAANRQGSDLSRADLREANLKGADLSGANLEQARLEFATLEGTRKAPDWRRRTCKRLPFRGPI